MPYLRPLDLNKGAILEDTSGVPHSQPIHVGAYSRSDERERLRSCYTMFHNYKCVPKNVMAHPRSMRLLAGTNEYAEDLTGQRAPLNASGWRSETKARYDGKLLRPMSAPVRRIISLMDNEEPVFGKTHQHFDPQLKDVYPHKGLRKTFHLFFKLSIFNTYFSHRPFAGSEMLASSHWNNRPDKLPWLQDPTTHFKLQCRQPSEFAEQRLHPTEAQIATLPHYTDPLLKLARTENQTSYGDPYVAPNFYHEEPNKVKKPRVQHLERSFIN